jgi:hypothetical protein
MEDRISLIRALIRLAEVLAMSKKIWLQTYLARSGSRQGIWIVGIKVGTHHFSIHQELTMHLARVFVGKHGLDIDMARKKYVILEKSQNIHVL